MAKFFIDRPIFAWVIALFIIIAGLISIRFLPVAQYPQVAPPTISLRVTYPGADASTIDSSVMSQIEDQMNGLEGLEYMESKSNSNAGVLTLTFKTGTDSDLAQVDVQNRLARIEAKLPAAVKQYGVQVSQSNASGFLAVLMLYSDDPNITIADIGDYAARNVLPEVQRISGVGGAMLFGGEKAMRIWTDPARLRALNLSFDDVMMAIRAQNTQVSAGALGSLPNLASQTITAPISVEGQLKTTQEFEDLIVRANTDGSFVRLKDVAKVELAAQTYIVNSRLNGKPAVGIGVQLSNTGNAIEVASLLKQKMGELERFFPANVHWQIPYDSSIFVGLSIEKVVHTLIEAVALVFVVMFLFLQNLRYTLIPTIVVPISLLGALAITYAAGMSINVLTMFAMVLVIGIVVDDAIVVVENVERIMAQEGLSPLEATKKGMSQISGAVIGITVVLISVFIPMAFFSGATGNIYRQFSLVMAVAIAFSAFLALSLTPALCATLLKPVDANRHEKEGVLARFFTRFNRRFDHTAKRYESRVGRLLQRGVRMLVLYIVLIAAALFGLSSLPKGFLPTEDQGSLMAIIQLPPDATMQRTLNTVRTYEDFVMKQPEVKNVVAVVGFGPAGQAQNVGMSFITLKPWSERSGKNSNAVMVAGRITGNMMQQIKDGFVMAINPPAIQGMGSDSGFAFRLQDRGSKGHEALLAARNQLIGMAMQSGKFAQIRPDGLEDAPQLQVNINRDAAAAQGINFASINSTLASALGSSYVNDFPNGGRLQQVIVQAGAKDRMQPEDVLNLTVLNNKGQAVPLSAIASARWINGPMQITRYNGYPAMAITGTPQQGISSGEIMAEVESLAAKLPPGFGFEWTGQSREEIQAGSQVFILYAFSILAVFLCLAALYESWTIPLAVILVVPLGFLGVVVGTWLRNLINMGWWAATGSLPLIISNDVYFQVAIITVIGLSAKNAILIVEFAKDLQSQGKNPFEAALAAAHLRFRPIIMTSFAFIMGVIPLFFASGASSASQREIGTGVFFGMLIGTLLSIFFVPMFYTAVRSWFKDTERQRERYAEHAREAGITPELAEQYLHDAESGLSESDRQALHEEGKDIP